MLRNCCRCLICVLILIILEYIYIKRSKNFCNRQWYRLNPYYTGIHLHLGLISVALIGLFVLILIILEYIYIVKDWIGEQFQRRLNPYYTGIHLHFSAQSHEEGRQLCLNPYYTGIHLHLNWQPMPNPCGVLILIILEYIYITCNSRNAADKACLNPYYTGIHLHILIIRLL